MPAGLVRKLNIVAAADGLNLHIIHGTGARRHTINSSSSDSGNNESLIRIDYRTNSITTGPQTGATTSASSIPNETQKDDDIVGLEAYGLVGLLTVSPSCSVLISITERKQVAQIHGKPIYAVTNVALIPTSSQADAARGILQARGDLSRDEHELGETESEDEDIDDDGDAASDGNDNESDGSDTDISSNAAAVPPENARTAGLRDQDVGGIAEDVIGKKVQFGRFAASWLSKKALGLSGLRAVNAQGAGVISGNGGNESSTAARSTTFNAIDPKEGDAINPSNSGPSGCLPPQDDTGEEDSTLPGETVELIPKLLRYTKMIFASQNFFFAYDYDLTRPTGALNSQMCHMPLHKVVDPLYFWNRHLMTSLIEADVHSLVLPLMQGFVGQKEFTVAVSDKQNAGTEGKDEEDPKSQILGEKKDTEFPQHDSSKRTFLLTLISRRSVERPGLRYLRRGVDDDGNTANTVETEQVLSAPDWNPKQNIYSYLQVRGSVPLYFSQSPYAFKPVPVLQHSPETNQLAFGRHFRKLGKRYGKLQGVSLIDKQGGESKVGEQYERHADQLNASSGIDGCPLSVEWFDFHNECRGMKFENVRKLVNILQETLDDFGDTVIHDGTVIKRQAGIIRTNCMDCLDRTGVTQCAFGQWALEHELKHEGISIDLHDDSSTQWFNILWADNGDAISKQYSSTAALKGDYTRTRKRNYRGALNDLGLTLSRYFNNAVNDYFSQACIDYLLGNVSTHVFEEFEQEMQSVDPGISVDKLRQNAVDTSRRIVISEQTEEFLGGWTMLTPRQPNTLRSLPLEESVFLLTDAAVYTCRFDWSTDKVLSFGRVDLRSITRINYGTYITSILTEAQTDKKTNVGLVIVHSNGDENSLRVNTRSLQSNVSPSALDGDHPNNNDNDNDNSNNDGADHNDNEWDIIKSWLKTAAGQKSNSSFIAFKALPLSNSATNKTRDTSRGVSANVSELDFVRCICEEIERAAAAAVAADNKGREQERLAPPVVEETDIISPEDAKKRTSYLEHLFYDIKKMVWA